MKKISKLKLEDIRTIADYETLEEYGRAIRNDIMKKTTSETSFQYRIARKKRLSKVITFLVKLYPTYNKLYNVDTVILDSLKVALASENKYFAEIRNSNKKNNLDKEYQLLQKVSSLDKIIKELIEVGSQNIDKLNIGNSYRIYEELKHMLKERRRMKRKINSANNGRKYSLKTDYIENLLLENNIKLPNNITVPPIKTNITKFTEEKHIILDLKHMIELYPKMNLRTSYIIVKEMCLVHKRTKCELSRVQSITGKIF